MKKKLSLFYNLSLPIQHLLEGLLCSEVTTHDLEQNKMSQLNLYFQLSSNILSDDK